MVTVAVMRSLGHSPTTVAVHQGQMVRCRTCGACLGSSRSGAPCRDAYWVTENGAVLCGKHRPSSDFHTSRLSSAELAQWRVILNRSSAVSVPTCEYCRATSPTRPGLTPGTT